MYDSVLFSACLLSLSFSPSLSLFLSLCLFPHSPSISPSFSRSLCITLSDPLLLCPPSLSLCLLQPVTLSIFLSVPNMLLAERGGGGSEERFSALSVFRDSFSWC